MKEKSVLLYGIADKLINALFVMKCTLSILLITLSFYGFNQPRTQSDSLGYKGPVKSIYTYYYSDEKSDTLADQKFLFPTCEVCEHYEKFNKKGQLIEKQDYIIIEPMSDLAMGYCHRQTYTYEEDELINITSIIFEDHGLGTWKKELEEKMNGTTYSRIQIEDSTILTEHQAWGEIVKKYFYKGMLVKDPRKMYTYDDKGRLVKTVSIEKSPEKSPRVETWTYEDNILLSHTSIRSGDYFSGSQTVYDYYTSGKLYSEKKIQFS